MLSWYLAASSTAGFGCGVFPFTEGIACVSLIMHTTVCSAMGRNACRDCCRIGFRLSAEYAHTAVMFVVNLRKSTDKSRPVFSDGRLLQPALTPGGAVT